jgi:hypothetical protein
MRNADCEEQPRFEGAKVTFDSAKVVSAKQLAALRRIVN